jgi:hypothetical protein
MSATSNGFCSGLGTRKCPVNPDQNNMSDGAKCGSAREACDDELKSLWRRRQRSMCASWRFWKLDLESDSFVLPGDTSPVPTTAKIKFRQNASGILIFQHVCVSFTPERWDEIYEFESLQCEHCFTWHGDLLPVVGGLYLPHDYGPQHR